MPTPRPSKSGGKPSKSPKKPASRKPAGGKPAGGKPAGRKPVGRKSAGRKPAGDRKVSKEPASESKASVMRRARVAVAAAASPTRKFGIDAARLMSDLHCDNVVIFDTQGKSDVMDYVIIASGTSDRQMRSVADDLRDLAKAQDMGIYGKELDERTTWVVIDLVEVVIHIFEPQARAYYDLEMMWGDCPQVKWKR